MSGAASFATRIALVLVILGFILVAVGWSGAAGFDYLPGQFPYLLSGGVAGLGLIILGTGLAYVQTARYATARRGEEMRAVNDAIAKLTRAARAANVRLPAPDELPALGTGALPVMTGRDLTLPPPSLASGTALPRVLVDRSTATPVDAPTGLLPVADLPVPAGDAAYRPPADATAPLVPARSARQSAAAAVRRAATAPTDAPADAEQDDGAAGQVVAGRSSFHRLDCRLVATRDDLPHLPRDTAEADGLVACRICKP